MKQNSTTLSENNWLRDDPMPSAIQGNRLKLSNASEITEKKSFSAGQLSSKDGNAVGHL